MATNENEHFDDSMSVDELSHLDLDMQSMFMRRVSGTLIVGPALIRDAAKVTLRARHVEKRDQTRIRKLKRARALLHARYFEDITLADLAEAASMSLHHFCRSYAKYFGHSASTEQLQLRLALAEYLLGETAMGVAQIAKASGFGCRTTMFRRFVRHRGKSPEDVRREIRNWQRALRVGESRNGFRAVSSSAATLMDPRAAQAMSSSEGMTGEGLGA